MTSKGTIRVSDLVRQQGEWLKGTGPEADIVMSTRIRVARNLAQFPFMTVASHSDRKQVEAHIRERILTDGLPQKLAYLALHQLSAVERLVLLERHLISREHANGEGERGVAVSQDERVAIMVNEEDHLRIQVMRSGFEPADAFRLLGELEEALEARMSFSFHPKYGYVTACPTNLGTAMRVSVMLHLPGLIYTKQVEKVLQSLQRVHYAIRGFFGEGTSPAGDFFQVSNQICLGRTEQQIVEELSQVVPEIVRVERAVRQKLLSEQRARLEDRIFRSLGILNSCRVLQTEEAYELLSALRMGVHMGVITNIPIAVINELILSVQPGHLQVLHGKELDAARRDIVRADLVRARLKHF